MDFYLPFSQTILILICTGIVIFIGLFYFCKHKQKVKKENERKERKGKFINSEEYRLLIDFLKKYKPFSHHPDKIKSLHEILQGKGHLLSYDDLIELFEEESEKTKFQDFSSPILKHNPQKLEEYINEFLNSYGDTYDLYIDDFMRLLKERGFTEVPTDFTSTVLEKLKKRKKEKDLQKFERGLSSVEESSDLKDEETPL